MKKRFSEAYHLYCEAVEESLKERLGRPLTEAERLSIWNIGSLLLLESFDRALASASSTEDIMALLRQQAHPSKASLERVLESLTGQVTGLLSRSLSYKEERKLHSIRMVEEAMHIIECLQEVSPDQRELAFQDVLNGHA